MLSYYFGRRIAMDREQPARKAEKRLGHTDSEEATKKPSTAGSDAERIEKAKIKKKGSQGSVPEKPSPENEEKTKIKTVLDGIKKARENSKKRNFEQTWTISVNLKDINLKKPENRFSYDFSLPKGRGKPVKIAMFTDSLTTLAKKAEGIGLVVSKNEIEKLAKDRKKMKKIANEYDWFYSEVSLMPLIGKSLGAVLGPRGKVPKPVPPNAKIEPFVAMANKTIRISLKESPVVHMVIGSEKMPDDDVAANADAVLESIKEKLPKGVNNIKSVHVKLTMGPAVKVPFR